MIRQYVILVLVLTLFLPQLTYATSSATVGVFRDSSKKFIVADPNDGEIIVAGTLENRMGDMQHEDYDLINILSNDGLEWITRSDYNKIGIYDQQYNLTDKFTFSSSGGRVAIGVGNLSDNYPGPEIAVCRTKSKIPRLKVYAYDESVKETKLFGFKPFGNEKHYYRGCSEIAIGDVDGDNENEIVVFRGHEREINTLVNIYDSTGELESTFTLSALIHDDDINDDFGKMYVDNIDNTDKDEIVFQGDAYTVYAYDGQDNQLYEFNSDSYNGRSIKKIDVADIDGDGKAEVVIQQMGKKVPILILNSDGTVETSYNLYPEATTKASRFMFLGDFSTVL